MSKGEVLAVDTSSDVDGYFTTETVGCGFKRSI